VLNAGRKIFEGKLGDAVRDPQVVEVFLGSAMPSELG
jgi:ABC-type branched-subunit amino acid transport system ATPase component